MLWVPYIGNAYTRCWIVNMIAFGYLVNLKVVVTTQHPMGMSNRLTVVLQQELH